MLSLRGGMLRVVPTSNVSMCFSAPFIQSSAPDAVNTTGFSESAAKWSGEWENNLRVGRRWAGQRSSRERWRIAEAQWRQHRSLSR